eukprot:TRINITY_DN6896_c0_g1_i1.p1 TRINITY_DN6896_c0_g1~~TRINITY_DN6896_c0_g1_i1.p1  ORF type:complete len:869 (-),score=305.12 TRINITY_DN6896_c0_g1_i1:110-2545(-)
MPTLAAAAAEESSDDEEAVARKRNKKRDSWLMRRNPSMMALLSAPVALTPEEEEDNEQSWAEERQCFVMLLQARMILRRLVHEKMFFERKNQGDLTAIEVFRLLTAQKEAPETDFVTEITELKRNLLSEIRKVNEMEREVDALDKSIGLLIGNVYDVKLDKRSRKKHEEAAKAKTDTLSAVKLEKYSNLFYLLQTEPLYLAKLMDCIEDPDQVHALLDTIILTLYGNAFAPREEFLLLSFFRHSIDIVMSHVNKASDFIKQTFLPDMVLTYNKRKQGQDFLVATLASVMQKFLHAPVKFDLNARLIHDTMITEAEIQTGVKSTSRNLTDGECAAVPEVQAEINKRVDGLKSWCQQFLDSIMESVNKVPYGLRWICKQIHDACHDAFPQATEDDISKLIVHFVYFRFINLGIVTPDTFGIVSQVSPESVFSLLQVSKVLYNLFNITPFNPSTERWMVPLNEWIMDHADITRKFLHALIQVDEPEDYLQVDRYMELTHLVKPVILIKPRELTLTHEILQENLSDITLKSSDPLVTIMKELGSPESYPNESMDIQLTLVNKFPVNEQVSEESVLYNKAKSLTMQVLRQLPPEIAKSSEPTLADILEAGSAYAKEKGDAQLQPLLHDLKECLAKLEAAGKVSKADGYSAFTKAVALEIANRQKIREQQKKELSRLHASMRNVSRQHKYLQEQRQQYLQYRELCREGQGKTKVKGKLTKVRGPFRFKYLELVKKGVVIDSEVPKLVQKVTKFEITCTEPGVFRIEVKIPGVTAEPLEILLDDLLEKKSKNIEKDVRSHVTLDVNMTIFLINKLFNK